MRKPALSAATLVIALGALAACGSDSDQKSTERNSPPTATAGTSTEPAVKPLTAGDAFARLSTAVASAKLSSVVTEENDRNKLIGRPNQYTSKITFTDSRIKSEDVADAEPGSVGLGGAIEVFMTPADAQARAAYIQRVTKGLPMLVEYDYVSGTVLIRVSHYLTPTQAADYKTAAAKLSY